MSGHFISVPNQQRRHCVVTGQADDDRRYAEYCRTVAERTPEEKVAETQFWIDKRAAWDAAFEIRRAKQLAE